MAGARGMLMVTEAAIGPGPWSWWRTAGAGHTAGWATLRGRGNLGVLGLDLGNIGKTA